MEGAKILIADDDLDIRESLQVILESRGYNVATAANKPQCMERIMADKPDLLILDIMMDSWQDGFEIARELKQAAEFKELPILMLTGVRNKTGMDFKSAAGDETWCPVEGFLEKPVEPDVLVAEVEKLLPKA